MLIYTGGEWTDALNVLEKGADKTGTNDSAAAFASAVERLPSTGGTIYVPSGVYKCNSLVEVAKPSVRFVGDGFDQSTVTNGSVIKAGANIAALIKSTSAAPSFSMDHIALNGAGSAEAVLLIEGLNCMINESMVRQPKTAGSAIKVTGESVWLHNLRINNANQAETTGIILNGTDATIEGCKPVNCMVGIEMQENSNGCLLTGNHFTPGNTIGKQCIWMSKQGGNIGIVNNRFDNHLAGAAMHFDLTANTRALNITGNTFFQNGIENEKFPAISIDTTSGSFFGTSIVGNTVRSETSHLYLCLLGANKKDGTAATNRGRIATAVLHV